MQSGKGWEALSDHHDINTWMALRQAGRAGGPKGHERPPARAKENPHVAERARQWAAADERIHVRGEQTTRRIVQRIREEVLPGVDADWEGVIRDLMAGESIDRIVERLARSGRVRGGLKPISPSTLPLIALKIGQIWAEEFDIGADVRDRSFRYGPRGHYNGYEED